MRKFAFSCAVKIKKFFQHLIKMSSLLPCEILIEKLVNNSHQTLSSLRNNFTFFESVPIESVKVSLSSSPEGKLKNCKVVLIYS